MLIGDAGAASVTGVFSALLDLVAPPTCVACREPSEHGPLCSGCRGALPWLYDTCPRCGLPEHRRSCAGDRAAWDFAWSPLAYEGAARSLVLALKASGSAEVADVMAAAIAARLPQPVRERWPLVVPVPAHPTRHRERGFDHTAVIAERLRARLDLDLRKALERTDRGPRHSGASRLARAHPIELRTRRGAWGDVLLVDDVHTTGATLDACARALKRAGAGWVGAVAYARTL